MKAKQKKKWGAVLIVLLIGAGFFWLMTEAKRKSFIYPNTNVAIPDNFTYLGVDISHHQGEINFQEMREMRFGSDSISFAYIKATEGVDFEDHRLLENIEGVGAEEIQVGCYHYFRPGSSAERQAAYFVETIASLDTDLLPVVDVEEIGTLSPSEIVDSVKVFINTVQKETGDVPVIYTFESFYRDYLRSGLKDYTFWIAAYKAECVFIEDENVVIWQYTDQGLVNGVGEYVDLNVAKGKFDELIKK